MQTQQSWHIASYPRSGNHLVRAIIEAYTHRPTEGCLGAIMDPPIFKKPANKSKLIQIRSDQVIGYKAHYLREIHERDRTNADGPMGMILITRDPVAAISSQATRILSNKWRPLGPTSRRKRIIIQEQINLYLSLIFRYVAQKDGPKAHVKYEDLIAEETAEATAKKLLDKLGVELEGPSLFEVFKLAKESQSSLGDSAQKLRQEIEQIVSARISYVEILNHIREENASQT